MKFTLKELGDKVEQLLGSAESKFKAELTELKNSVSAAVSGVQAQLTSANESLTSITTALKAAVAGAKLELKADATGADMVAGLTGKIGTLETGLNTASTELSSARTLLLTHLATIPGHEDYKEGGKKAGATLAELIAAEQNATNTAMAATNIKVETIPTGGTAPEAANAKKPVNLTEACLKANKKA